MIELVYGNRTENLLEKLAADLEIKSPGTSLLQPIEIITPNRNMQTWIRLNLAQKLGIAANLHFSYLETYLGGLIEKTCPHLYSLANHDTITGAILAVFENEELLKKIPLKPLRQYLFETFKSEEQSVPPVVNPLELRQTGQGPELKKVQLATRLAGLFQEYTFSRPEMTALWRGDRRGEKHFKPALLKCSENLTSHENFGQTASWQKALWREVFGEEGILDTHPPATGGRWITLDEALLDDELFESFKARGLPTIYVFGVSYVARLFQMLFARLGQVGELKLYVLNPCAEFWEDMETHRELFRRLHIETTLSRCTKKTEPVNEDGEDPFGLLKEENHALSYWGRPGREHIRMMNELTECDFTEAFSDPLSDGANLLPLLQQDILMRAERLIGKKILPTQEKAAEPLAPGDTLKLICAPSVRRETQWVAEEIWRLVEASPGSKTEARLRFSDIAVIVNSAEKDIYLPRIEAAFKACHSLPCSVSDLPATADSNLLETFSLLLRLPFGRFSRAEMLALITRPAITGNFDALKEADITDLAARLNIFFGADRADHQNTYIDEDVFNWDQAVRRLALGAMMTGDKSGENRIFTADEGRWLVEEVSGSAKEKALEFNMLVRSLLTDTRFIAEEEGSLSDWALYFRELAEKYLTITSSADDGQLMRLAQTLARLENFDFGRPVKGKTAAELSLRLLGSLGGFRGQYLAEGVVVSSFLPMRAIPFKVIFLLGLGESLFPALKQRDALDLRSAFRLAGDVNPAERDRYMFLETLLCARQKLYISYVGRDEQTGDSLEPSAVVQELKDILKKGYLGKEGLSEITISPPLRRHDEVLAGENVFSDEAQEEAQIKKLSESWQKAGGNEPAALADGLSAANLTPLFKTITEPEKRAELTKILKLTETEPLELKTPPVVLKEEVSASTPEKQISLSVYQLKQFLLCPLQGWAKTMLNLPEEDDEEEGFLVEEEDFAPDRRTETHLLKSIYSQQSTGGGRQNLYRDTALLYRLQGRLPQGSLSQIYEKQHLEIFKGWTSALNRALPEKSTEELARLFPLKRVRFGHTPWPGEGEITLNPLEVELTPPLSCPGQKPFKVRLTGLSELLSPDQSVSLRLAAGKPPEGKDLYSVGRIFRHLLHGLVDQALLAAAAPEAQAKTEAICLFAQNADTAGFRKLKLKRPEKEAVYAWLSDLLSDLFFKTHAYLLPIEAVSFEYYKHCKDSPYQPDDIRLIKEINKLVQDVWAKFSSLWGPVPQPRTYNPPEPDEAQALAKRRFGLLFDQIYAREGF